MKYSAIIFFVLFNLSHGKCQVADSLRNESGYYYLADINLRITAKLILTDSIYPSDNLITFSSMDSIAHVKKEVRDFYFPVFRKIVSKSDGALAEVVGSYVLHYVRKYPKEFSERYTGCFTQKSCSAEVVRLASFAGEEILYGDPDKEYAEFVNQISKGFRKWKSDKLMTMFLNEVEQVIAKAKEELK